MSLENGYKTLSQMHIQWEGILEFCSEIGRRSACFLVQVIFQRFLVYQEVEDKRQEAEWDTDS